MTLSDRIARGVKATFVARVLVMAANAALLLALTRYLMTPAEYGLLYFALSVLGVAALFGSLGLPKATARYVAEYDETDPGQIPRLLERTVLALAILAVIVTVALAAGSGLLADVLGEPALVPFLVLGGGYVAGRATLGYLRTVFQGFNRVELSAVVNSVNAVARLLVVTGLVLAGFGVLGAMVGYVVAFALAVVVGLLVLYRYFYRAYPRADEPEEGLFRRVLEYSVPTTATNASVVLDSKVDTVLVGALLNATAVGYYTLARQIADFCIVPAQSIGFTITPTFGEQKAAGQIDRAARVYEQALEMVLLLYVPAATGLALVAEPAVRYVVGPDYLGAVPVLQLYAVFVVVRAVHKITGSGLDYLGLARVRAIARGTSAVGNVALNLLLIPIFGVLGAAIATVVTYSLYTLVNVYYIHREFSLRLDYVARRGLRIATIAGVMGVAVVATVPYVTDVPSLLATVALGGGIWAGLAMASGLLDPREVRAFLS